MCVVLSSPRARTTHGRSVYTEPSQLLARPWASVQEIRVATTKYGYTWTLSAIDMLMSHEETMSNVSSSRKGPAPTRLTKRKGGTTLKVTIRFHPCHLFESSCFHKLRYDASRTSNSEQLRPMRAGMSGSSRGVLSSLVPCFIACHTAPCAHVSCSHHRIRDNDNGLDCVIVCIRTHKHHKRRRYQRHKRRRYHQIQPMVIQEPFTVLDEDSGSSGRRQRSRSRERAPVHVPKGTDDESAAVEPHKSRE